MIKKNSLLQREGSINDEHILMMANIIFFWSSQTLLENKIIAGSADMRLGDLLSYWVIIRQNGSQLLERGLTLRKMWSRVWSRIHTWLWLHTFFNSTPKPHSSSWGPFSPLQIPFLFKGFQIPFALLKMIKKI